MNRTKTKRFSLGITILAVLLTTVFAVSSKPAHAAAICTPATAISGAFAKDGVGDFCWQTTSLCSYINSWNLTTLEINGTSYVNTYQPGSSIPALNGTYTIHYNSAVAWGHFEIGALCASGPTNTPTKTLTLGPTSTQTQTPTLGATSTRTSTVTTGPTNTLTKTLTLGPSNTPTQTRTQTSTASITPTSDGTNPCTTPTLLTGGGTFSVSTAGTCFKYVDANFKWGAMLSIRNMAADTNTIKWIGALSEGQSSCVAQSQVLVGTNGQLNNFVTPKDTSNAMYFTVVPSANTTVQVSIANWQNGTGCLPPPTITPTPTITSTATKTFTPSPTRTATSTPTFGPSPTAWPSPTHLANPFTGATFYVNHDWKGSATFNVNTFLWMDSIAAVNGTGAYTHSLADHLDLALAQGANAVTLVIYDLPNRDCSALSSNGELLIANNGSARYKTEYIDNIYNVLSRPQYGGMRFIAVIEPDSLPNLITNTSFPKCQAATSVTDGYVVNTQYTLNKFYTLRNFYSYLDIGHAGWLGWPTNFGPAITLVSNMVKGTTHGVNSIDGFVDNTANTQVETETYLSATTMIGSNPVRSGSFFDWNDYIDESHYATAWIAAMQAAGLPASSTNMIFDTSRNGWGGCGGGPYALQTCRPTKTSTSTVLDTYINESRIDRRPAKGDWCNQNGAGIGKLPFSTPTAPYQAYVWVKPPGESDGSSVLIPVGPDNPDGKGLDGMCDPTYMGNTLNEGQNSNALPNAPLSGAWFQAQFDQLVANKYP